MNEDKINQIIKIGVPLPEYNYDYHKFTISIPINISNGDGGVMGITKSDLFDTFDSACDAIIEWDTAQRRGE